MAKIYHEKDANLKDLKGKTVAVIGYGSQGHAHALNLRDSGVDVIVGELKGSDNHKLAVRHGFKPVSAAEAARKGDVVVILLPDEMQGRVYQAEIGPGLKKGNALVFAHGFNIHFGQIVPPKDIDVLLVAPKGPGHLVRSEFEAGRGVPNLIAVCQNPSKKALKIALAYSRALGGLRAGAIETTFAEETETDLFGEQVILCGGVSALIKASFETLVEAGYQPELAYFEVLHELSLIVNLLIRGGLTYMRYSVSNTAEYGDLTRGPRIITDETRAEMKRILAEIRSGRFAKEWILESQAGRPVFNALAKKDEGHLIEQVGKRMRKLMPWIDAK